MNKIEVYVRSTDTIHMHKVTITKEEWDMYRVVCVSWNIDQEFEKDDILGLLEDLPWLI